MFIRARDNLLMAVSINLSVLSLYSFVCIGVCLYDECFLSPCTRFSSEYTCQFYNNFPTIFQSFDKWTITPAIIFDGNHFKFDKLIKEYMFLPRTKAEAKVMT